jgi:hypothetical protein
MHLSRTLAYDEPVLQLEPDSGEDCMVLEVLARFGIPTIGPATVAEEARLQALVSDRPLRLERRRNVLDG